MAGVARWIGKNNYSYSWGEGMIVVQIKIVTVWEGGGRWTVENNYGRGGWLDK
jgi:hypothetical protein